MELSWQTLTKGLRRAVRLLLSFWMALSLSVPFSAYAEEKEESTSGPGTTFTFVTEEAATNNSEDASEAEVSPQTGDTSDLALWLVLLFASGCAAAASGAAIMNKKEK